MSDDDAQLRSAFAELHRRQQAEAPSFETMREEALRIANPSGVAEASRPAARSFLDLRLAGWATVACAIVVSFWIFGAGGGRRDLTPAASPTVVDQMITRIEERVDYHAAIALPEYPSDALLTPSSADSSL